MKKKIDQIIMKLRENKPVLEEKYSVKNLEVFGSYVLGEQKKGSDLDVPVDFYKTIDLFKYIELENYLSETLGVKVDLVMKDAPLGHELSTSLLITVPFPYPSDPGFSL